MPDTDSVTLVKTMSYRGKPEEWSNTYHLDGTTPTTEAGWKALIDAIHASEKHCYGGASKLVRGYGYEAGNIASVAQIDYSVLSQTGLSGDADPGGSGKSVAGDQAAWVRARVGLSSTGKKVYVRKYFHSVWSIDGQPDVVLPACKTNMVTHATLMLAGSLPGGMKWVGPQGATPVEPKAGDWMTTRTLKRRGKRPTAP